MYSLCQQGRLSCFDRRSGTKMSHKWAWKSPELRSVWDLIKYNIFLRISIFKKLCLPVTGPTANPAHPTANDEQEVGTGSSIRRQTKGSSSKIKTNIHRGRAVKPHQTTQRKTAGESRCPQSKSHSVQDFSKPATTIEKALRNLTAKQEGPQLIILLHVW